MEEVDRGVTRGPLPVRLDKLRDVACVVRRGIWECHGEPIDPTVRIIDDCLEAESNSTCGAASSHRPADGDSMAAQCRVVTDACPDSATGGTTSDFAKAYKQVPKHPSQRRMRRLLQYNPNINDTVAFEPLSLLFGGSEDPQQFSRFPAWVCFCLAVALAVGAQHCVDDLILIEEIVGLLHGWTCWRILAMLPG